MVNRSALKRVRKLVGTVTAASLVVQTLVPIFAAPAPAAAASVTGAAFTAGGVVVDNIRYAKTDQTLTLTVNTSNNTKCVEVIGAHEGSQKSDQGKSTWTFSSFTAGTGDGVKTVTATAYQEANPHGKCVAQRGEEVGLQSASYILDNTAPSLLPSNTNKTGLAPAPNAAGWNNSDVTITWSATDSGSGIGSGPTPATDSVTETTTIAGVAKTSTASDRLGNSGNGSVTVKLDKTAPTISPNRSPAANAYGWNNTDVTVSFTCSDVPSGIKSCPSGATTLSSNGANQSVTGTAVDNADNSVSATVAASIDKTAPTLSGVPTTSPNPAGWYNTDVTVRWSASDALSGIMAVPADSTISSEGTGRTTSATVSDKADNVTNATSSPAVNIDKTAPSTTASAPPAWNNADVTVSLNPDDALSGVKSTHYKLNGGAQQTGTSVAISTEGVHTLQYWSVDNAGNVETAKSVQVKIDKTPPTISHTQSPAANALGWNNTNVTVTFTCNDAVSGIASCTAPQTVTTEGENQPVTGTALDNAGHTATDPATVSIDKTAPTISAAPDRAPNTHNWYKDDVTVSFTCRDALSGIASCSPAQTLGEGANQSATGTATDAAGNNNGASVSGINIDKTAPSLSGSATTLPNGNGWYNTNVVVAWACSETLSGIDGTCPANSTVSGEGDNLSASATVSDKAGNTTSKTVSGIKIDRTAPSTSASVVPPVPESGWYKGAVEVTLTGVDILSNVDKTYYSVGDGAAQDYGGPFSFSQHGIHTITFWSVDKAGNTEDKAAAGHSITLQIDNVLPTITGSRLPAANNHGWNNVPVTVSFECKDADSGIAGCTAPTPLENQGAGQSVTGLATDNAGNANSATVNDINIDRTAPTLTGAATTNPNGYNWYKSDVVIKWTGEDGLSGIDPATQPGNSTITSQGSNLGAGPVSISDKAGNSTSASVSGIKIDRTAPTITGSRAPAANSAGWNNSPVTVSFVCSDALSDIATCPAPVVLDQDGSPLSATGTAKDKADNEASTTVGNIKIDSQAPKSDADLVCNIKNGWCNGSKPVSVKITATDQAGLSGVKEIHYSVNGGPWQTGAGTSTEVNVPLAAKSGMATVEFYAADNAGNPETKNSVSLKYDTIAPTITHSQPGNAAGWSNANTAVRFTASDDSDGSGIDKAALFCGPTLPPTGGTVTADSTNAKVFYCDTSWSTETAGQAINAQSDDLAGNTGKDSVTVKLDKTAPTISAQVVNEDGTPRIANNGWYNSAARVRFTCSDPAAANGSTGSGIATCPADVVVTTNGANQEVSGTAEDKADNTASVTLKVSVDSLKPTITLNDIANGGTYILGAVPQASCTAADTGGSGLAGPCSVSVTGGTANGVGTFSYTATAADNAGNTTTLTGSYTVIYNIQYGVAFFLQPINDTAHTTGSTTSVFKAGSTVPVKFQLKDANGQIIQANSAPLWITPAKGSATTQTISEELYGDVATTGTTYRWDGQQYIYNWGSPKNGANYFWRVGVKLDDGRTYAVNIGLR